MESIRYLPRWHVRQKKETWKRKEEKEGGKNRKTLICKGAEGARALMSMYSFKLIIGVTLRTSSFFNIPSLIITLFYTLKSNVKSNLFLRKCCLDFYR